MNIQIHPYRLEFRFPFRIAHGVRTHTDAVFLTVEQDGITATGEATLPPYLPDTQQRVMDYLSSIPLSIFEYPFDPMAISDYIAQKYPPCMPGRAALDMALWSYHAQAQQQSIRSLLNIPNTDNAMRTYTISVCDRVEMQERIAYGREMGFAHFKLKLDGKNDLQMIADYRSIAGEGFLVDANQSWSDMRYATQMSQLLVDAGCVLIEQPFHRDDTALTLALRQHTILPIIADEACQRLTDIPRLISLYDGINIKLQKCGGITEAVRMLRLAQSNHLKTIIGCMSESVVGCSAADTLSPLCDWCDLDGQYLVYPVPYKW